MTAVTFDPAVLDAVIESLPGEDLASVRQHAARSFTKAGFPTIGEEDWKYTNLKEIADISVNWLESGVAGIPLESPGDEALEKSILAAVDAHWIVVRDGAVETGPFVIDDVDVGRLTADDFATSSADDAMSSFNAALLREGIRISAGPSASADKPIGILYVDSPSNVVVQTRVFASLAANSHLSIFEVCASSGDGRQFTNSVFEAHLDDGAQLQHVRLQIRQAAHSGLNRLQARLGKDAGIHHNSFDFGGALTRNDVVTDIAGTGASVTLNGLYLSSGRQHIDNHTCIVHGTGPSTSREEYRGILSGNSQCVFNGKVIVAEGADGTDSSQSNHNLLLSDRAEIDTKPELEIYADDVKCAHGATIGQLDKASLFYLRSRGLDEDQARQVLTRAFAAGTLGSLSIPDCHDLIADRLDAKLASLVGELNE